MSKTKHALALLFILPIMPIWGIGWVMLIVGGVIHATADMYADWIDGIFDKPYLPPDVVTKAHRCANCGEPYSKDRPYGGVDDADGVHMCDPCWQAYEAAS